MSLFLFYQHSSVFRLQQLLLGSHMHINVLHQNNIYYSLQVKILCIAEVKPVVFDHIVLSSH